MPKLALRAQAVGIAVLPLRQSLMDKKRLKIPCSLLQGIVKVSQVLLILRLRIIMLRYNHDKNDEKMQIVHFCSNACVSKIAFRYLILN